MGQTHSHRNYLLDALAPEEWERVEPQLSTVTVKRGETLYSEGRGFHAVDFPIDAVFTIVLTLEAGDTCEVATIGCEGFVEADAALSRETARRTTECQIEGRVSRMPLRLFRDEMRRAERFASLVQRNIGARLFVAEQIGACNARHAVTERCARWLLMMADRVGKPTFPLTHDSLAMMLGVRRSGVSQALAALERQGAIAASRGRIEIVDAAALRAASCGCYEATNEAYREALDGAGDCLRW